ncbi:MAG: phage portal protein, partial [Kiritimatiellae bacterium]|nr:phage portal protein [Kiritimatiellia bacterium]
HLRRFTLAVVSAAEAAADFAGILYTDAPASGEADAVEAMDTIQLERNMLLTMPGGWKMSQVDPKQPVTTYGEFKREILNEIARCRSMPYNIAAGNSSGYNYASGRLDHQTYYKALKVDRSFMETEILDRVFDLWLKEWSLATRTTIDPCDCRHVWFWDGQEHVDPGKEATAQQIRLDARTTTLAAEYAKQGKDWETELRQIARERKLMKELGIESEETRKDSDNENEEKDGNE